MTPTQLKFMVLALIAIALFSAARGTMIMMSTQSLAANGTRITGTVHESDDRRESPWVIIDYTVTDADGTEVPRRDRFTVSQDLFDTIVANQTATIIYDPADPTNVTIDGRGDISFMMFIFGGVALLFALIIIVRWKAILELNAKQMAKHAATNSDAAP